MNIKRHIKEGIDDFEWMREIDPENYVPKKGENIRVINTGDKYDFLRWLASFADDYEDGDYIEGEVMGLYENNSKVGLKVYNNLSQLHNMIFFPIMGSEN